MVIARSFAGFLAGRGRGLAGCAGNLAGRYRARRVAVPVSGAARICLRWSGRPAGRRAPGEVAEDLGKPRAEVEVIPDGLEHAPDGGGQKRVQFRVVAGAV